MLLWTTIAANIAHSFSTAISQVVSATAVAVYAVSKYGFDSQATFYCGAATMQKMLDISMICFLLMALEALIIALFCYVYYLNLKKSCTYDLRPKYQAKENLAALRLLIPLVIPIYTVCSPLLLSRILTRYRMARSQDLVRMSQKVSGINDIYFSNYAWNRK
ncbi:hypothetical protein OESDEN_17033 [Oesophagostomum dentatum]|uniref:Uncharacterized protein n=1 Tax=Oesophagostomum dentatum TaxID=61180 RepID=A0A0B1SJ86_OESDE|nr:hypothetical protein OESDEN_17033 [Oesophagostomum dentatum]